MLPYYRNLLAPLFGQRSFILAISSLADTLSWVRILKELGASRPFILAAGVGAGDLPNRTEADWFVLESAVSDPLQLFRRFGELLGDLPPAAMAALDAYDPNRKAVVIMNGHYVHEEVGGRQVFANRRKIWMEFEDKTKIDVLWDALGVHRAPSQIVAAKADLKQASRNFPAPHGTVWSGDSREGTNGGSCYLRWVRDDEQMAAAMGFFRQHCDEVRIMPYLPGIPCSIHAFVFPDRVVVGRPIEQLTFVNAEHGTFLYGGVAACWDPGPAINEEMRSLARRVGTYLWRTVDYAGGFSIDGIATEEGFYPTEVNSRFSAGAVLLSSSVAEIPLALIDQCLRRGETLEYRSRQIENLLRERSASMRQVAGWLLTPRVFTVTEVLPLQFERDELKRAADPLHWDVLLTVGPSNVGGMLRFRMAPSHMTPHMPVGPAAEAILRFADRELGTVFGNVECAYRALPWDAPLRATQAARAPLP